VTFNLTKMNQAEYLKRARKRKKTGVPSINPDDVPRQTRNALTIRDRVANYIDPAGHGSSGDFHARRTKAITVSGKKVDEKKSTATTLSGRTISVTHNPKQDIRMHKQKHKGRSR
jgi:hypothetical protein